MCLEHSEYFIELLKIFEQRSRIIVESLKNIFKKKGKGEDVKFLPSALYGILVGALALKPKIYIFIERFNFRFFFFSKEALESRVYQRKTGSQLLATNGARIDHFHWYHH